MKKASFSVVIGFVIAAFGYHLVMSETQALPRPELPDSFRGDWSVSKYELQGVEYGHFSDCQFIGLGSGESSIVSSNGLVSSVTLQGFDTTGNGTAYFSIESTEDTAAMGGGGPRKAIGQVTTGGQLEIVAARSGGDDYPADFGDDSKNSSICWSFSKSDE